MRKQYFSFIFLYIFSSCLYSQTMDDNIIINCCEDSYVFKEGPGNNPIVQNTRKTEYEALRMGATVQPHMFYGEFISLDEAKAKGVLAPKAIHRHATPENVFFDDTRICYFNLSLSRQGKKAAVQFNRTFHDLRYFTHIYFPEEYFIRKKRITVTIPAALSRFRLVEKNFGPGIRYEKSVNKEGDSLFVYTLKRSACHPKGRSCSRRQLPLSPSAGDRSLCRCTGHVPLAERTGRGGLHSPPSRNADG